MAGMKTLATIGFGAGLVMGHAYVFGLFLLAVGVILILSSVIA